MNRSLRLMAIMIISLMFTGEAAFCLPTTAFRIPQNAESLHTTLKYCTNEIERGISVGGSEAKIAIQMPASTAEELKGNFITKIWIGLADVKSLDMGKLFVLPKLLSNPIHLQDIDTKNLKVGWNEIELTTPLEITGIELFIGYQFQYNNGVSPFGISLNGANSLGGWVCTNSAWLQLADSNIGGNHSLKVTVSGDKIPATYDLVLENLKAKEYTTTNTRINMTGKILNAGTNTINSFDVIYTINGTANTYSVKDLTLANDADHSFSIPLTFETNGTYNIDVEVANINGSGEDINADNNTGSVKVIVVTKYVKKKMLLEYFTSQMTYAEPDSKAYTEALLNGNRGVIWIGYHYNDIYALPENVALYGFYGVGTLPESMLDRMPYKGDMTFNSKELDASIVIDKLDNPAFMTVAIEGVYNPDNRNVVFNVLGDFTGNELEGKELRLTTMIVEDGLTTENQIGAGSHEYSPTVRAYLTDVLGNKIKQVSGGTYKASFSYEVPLEFNAENLKIVAFVNIADDNVTDGTEVLNAELKYLKDMKPIAVEEAFEEMAINIYPNPARNVINIEGDFTSVVIYNSYGQECSRQKGNEERVTGDYNRYSQCTIDVSDLEAGIYIVKATNGNSFVTRKITIVKSM